MKTFVLFGLLSIRIYERDLLHIWLATNSEF